MSTKTLCTRCVTWTVLASVFLPIGIFGITLGEKLHSAHDKEVTKDIAHNEEEITKLRESIIVKLDVIEDLVVYNSTMVSVIREDQKKGH